MGAGILMSTQYGARRYDRLRRQISTTLLGGLAFSAVAALVLILAARPLLALLQVPADILVQSENMAASLALLSNHLRDRFREAQG